MRLVYWRAPIVLDRTPTRRFMWRRGFRRKIAIALWGKLYRQPLPDTMGGLSIVWAWRGRKQSLSVLLSAGLPVALWPSVDLDRDGANWGVTVLWLFGCVACMWSTVDGIAAVAAAQKERLEAAAGGVR